MSETLSLRPGEKPMENAPEVTLAGRRCIPQHYLKYQHTLASVEQIIVDVQYDDRYPIFVGENDSQLYLQVGVIGFDNYIPKDLQDGTKIVYGRRWRIEPQLPTSEIIQTAFLALQKAREHEVRELFKLTSSAHTTTPFSCHQDLPLLAEQAMLLDMQPYQSTGETLLQTLQLWADNLRFDGARFEIADALKRANGKCLVDFALSASSSPHMADFAAKQDTIVLEEVTANALYFALIDKMIDWSNRHVEETFAYNGFRRFSRKNCVQGIAELSYLTREREAKRARDGFSEAFEQNNYETDKTRVPKLSQGALRDRHLQIFAKYDVRNGILPE